jgi:hypothetical protein
MTAMDFTKLLIKTPLKKYPPIITEKTHGKKWTEMEKTELDEYYKKNYSPKLNQAIPCGKINDLTIIDFDFYKEGKEETKRLYEEHFKPKCNYIVQSARGGVHCYFRYHDKLPSTQSDKMGIDILSNGKYAVAPESKTQNGIYKIIKGDEKTSLTTIDSTLYNLLLKYIYEKEEPEDTTHGILNDMFNVNFKWHIEEEKKGYKITHDSKLCLVERTHNHGELKHSCLYITNRYASITCFTHGKKQLSKKDYPELSKLKQELGLVKKKKDKEELNDQQILIAYLKEDCITNKYKKEGNYIIKPLKDIPTYYEPYLKFDDYLNQLYVDKGDETYEAYRRSTSNHKKIVEYLTCYNDVEIPRIKRNHKWITFNNGVLDIDSLTFMRFEDLDTNQTSGVYIKKDFNIDILNKNYDEIETPNFDKLIKYHIEDDTIYHILLAFIGRLFFQVGEKDNWQVMAFIRGQGNTGKSTLFISVIIKLFSPLMIGKIGREKTFGLQNLYDKAVIVNEDIDHNISKSLPASDFQSMVSGENMAISQKGKDMITTNWRVPMIWGGNILPDYKDKGGSISRRLAIFDMNKSIENKDTSLQHRIKDEIGLIVVKAVKSYYHYLNYFGNTSFVDWGKKYGIRYFDDRIEQVKQETNLLYSFLTAPRGANETRNSDIYIVHTKGAITPLERFKKYYKTYLHYKHDIKNFTWSSTADHAIVEGLGYKISRIHTCASCGERAKAPKNEEPACCSNYSRQNRRKKWVINDMEIRDDKDGY